MAPGEARVVVGSEGGPIERRATAGSVGGFAANDTAAGGEGRDAPGRGGVVPLGVDVAVVVGLADWGTASGAEELGRDESEGNDGGVRDEDAGFDVRVVEEAGVARVVGRVVLGNVGGFDSDDEGKRDGVELVRAEVEVILGNDGGGSDLCGREGPGTATTALAGGSADVAGDGRDVMEGSDGARTGPGLGLDGPTEADDDDGLPADDELS